MADNIKVNIEESEGIKVNIKDLNDQVKLFVSQGDDSVKASGAPLENQVAYFDNDYKRITGSPKFTYEDSKVFVDGGIKANTIVKSGGLSTEFLMADGSTSTSISTYTHDQGVPSSVWNITHNLGKYPSATVVDTGGRVVIGNVDYVDINTILVTFNSSFSGLAYLN